MLCQVRKSWGHTGKSQANSATSTALSPAASFPRHLSLLQLQSSNHPHAQHLEKLLAVQLLPLQPSSKSLWYVLHHSWYLAAIILPKRPSLAYTTIWNLTSLHHWAISDRVYLSTDRCSVRMGSNATYLSWHTKLIFWWW